MVLWLGLGVFMSVVNDILKGIEQVDEVVVELNRKKAIHDAINLSKTIHNSVFIKSHNIINLYYKFNKFFIV